MNRERAPMGPRSNSPEGAGRTTMGMRCGVQVAGRGLEIEPAFMRIFTQDRIANSVRVRLNLALCLAILTGCSSTSVDQVWRDNARTTAPLGKTLVIAVAP